LFLQVQNIHHSDSFVVGSVDSQGKPSQQPATYTLVSKKIPDNVSYVAGEIYFIDGVDGTAKGSYGDSSLPASQNMKVAIAPAVLARREQQRLSRERAEQQRLAKLEKEKQQEQQNQKIEKVNKDQQNSEQKNERDCPPASTVGALQSRSLGHSPSRKGNLDPCTSSSNTRSSTGSTGGSTTQQYLRTTYESDILKVVEDAQTQLPAKDQQKR